MKNYLSFTFQRLQYEDKLEKEAAAKNNRQPRLIILENQLYAVWNTGLEDNIYDPIYAYFMRNDGRTPTIKQPWVFMGFNTANSSQQKIMSSFPYRPERASYFNDPRELLYDTRATAYYYMRYKFFVLKPKSVIRKFCFYFVLKLNERCILFLTFKYHIRVLFLILVSYFTPQR